MKQYKTAVIPGYRIGPKDLLRVQRIEEVAEMAGNSNKKSKPPSVV